MYQAPRGTSDILPGEQAYWRYVEQKVAHICQLYGYERIDAPAFEDTGLFARSVGEETDIVEKEMYTFEDRGGNKITLRPEGTAPVCRAYLEHGLHNWPQPIKLYYIASIFRYERPQAGRYREHHQFGYEAIGDDDPALDAEAIDMAWQLFLSLDLQHLTLNLNSIGCKKCRPEYLTVLKCYYARYAPDLEIQLVDSSEGGRAAIVARQDGYDAARLLLGTLHERLAPKLKGDFYVAAPARDMFLALTTDPSEFVERLRQRVKLEYRRLPYPITADLFVVTRDGVAGTMAA